MSTNHLDKWSSNSKYEPENIRENLYPDVILILHYTVNVEVLIPVLL